MFNLYAKPIFQSKHNLNLAICHTNAADVNPMIETFTKTSRNLKAELKITKVTGTMNSL